MDRIIAIRVVDFFQQELIHSVNQQVHACSHFDQHSKNVMNIAIPLYSSLAILFYLLY